MKKALKFSRSAFCLLFLLSFSFGQENKEQDSSVLKSIYYQKLEQNLEVSITVIGNFIYQPFELKEPSRLVIDLSPVNEILCSPKMDINDFGVLSIRTAIFQPSIVRIVIDLQDQFPKYEISRTEEGLKVILGTEVTRAVIEAPAQERIPAITKEKVSEVPKKEKGGRENFYNTMIGLSAGSYRISDERYQEVYPGSGAIYGLSLSRVLFSSQRLDFDISLEARTFSKTGASTVTQEESKFSVTPLSAAARCLFRTKYAIFFLGVGADHYWYKEESGLYPAPGYVSGSASGGHIQTGIYFVFPKLSSLRVKLYFKLTRVLTTKNDIKANLGGREFGLGLSYGFNVF